MITDAPPMRRCLVIGCGGAGKSTLAKEIATRTGLPLVHLDQVHWSPGWVPTPPERWEAAVRRLAAQDRWVMDGNYGGTMELRLRHCDTVVFLDLPRWVCLARVLKRRVLGRRPDVIEGCGERLTWEFLRWIWRYRRSRRPQILERLARVPEKDIYILSSRRSVREFRHGFSGRLLVTSSRHQASS